MTDYAGKGEEIINYKPSHDLSVEHNYHLFMMQSMMVLVGMLSETNDNLKRIERSVDDKLF